MSEEEKIRHIKKRIENLKQGIGIMQINGITQQNWASDYEYLIDLYQKEKEKNNKIQKYVRSNEWAEDYEKSSCRIKILRILED